MIIKLVRCMFYWDTESNEVKSISRGGKNYDAATTHIRQSKKLIHLLSNRQTLILDGELYYHGMSLQEISGIARLKEWEPRCNILEFHCYDLAIEKDAFQIRLEKLELLQSYFISEPKIKILEHFKVFGEEQIKKYHDLWVAQGYEGAVLRDPVKEYGFNKRDVRMIKVKEFQDDEFKVTGWEEGLRPEDMVFILETKEGVVFKAKPIGDVAKKLQYIKDMPKLIGKKATVKYFYLTADGTPFLPVFKNFRTDD